MTGPVRSRRRRPGDAGVNQSAFVALLVVVILLIATALTVFGPQVGGAIARFWICELISPDSADCASQPVNPTGTTPPANPGDVVFSLGTDAVDPSMCDQIKKDHAGGSLSQFVQNNLHSFPLQTDPIDLGGGSGFTDWDGAINCGPDGISITIPEDEVHTDIWGWVIQVIAGTAGTLMGYLAEALCVASLGPAAVIACGLIRGYVTTFTWVLVAGLLSGQSIKDPSLWAASLAGGILGAAGGAVWTKYLKGWVDTQAQATLQKVADGIGALADKVWAVGRGALQKSRDYIYDMSSSIVDAFYRTARALGYEP